MEKVRLCGVGVHPLGLDAAARLVLEWALQDTDAAGRTRVVVTPNVDHVVMLERDEGLRRAYEHADLVLVDGMPLVWLARLFGQPVTERVAGSDLVPRILELSDTAPRPVRVYLFGAAPGIAERAGERIARQHPNLRIVGALSPPLGFERDADYERTALEHIRQRQPDLLLVGLGAPKQELWATRHRGELGAKVTICAGATIDFLAGERRRAPSWMRFAGVEWAYRLAQEPRRLGPRYLRDALALPRVVAAELTRGGGVGAATRS